jgi:hypothetical protein
MKPFNNWPHQTTTINNQYISTEKPRENGAFFYLYNKIFTNNVYPLVQSLYL